MDIQIENLTKRYGPQIAVDNISFTVKAGEILGFLGPNGAGKSTSMKMITGYIGIGEGDVMIGGRSVRQSGDELKKYIGYLPENNPLYLDMPVMDYLHFCAALQGVENSNIPGRVREMIRVCGLNAEKHKKIGELSKGYRQRVGLAQAVILSTHILPEVEATCDRILIINRGKIVADGTAESLRKQATGSELLKVKIEDGASHEIARALATLPSVANVDTIDVVANRYEVQSKAGESSRRDIFRLCVDKGWMLSEMIPVETRLEDIFRNLTMN
jgi:ABC-2 type transport system ATP-binding protein